jgi:hypothetical protein
MRIVWTASCRVVTREQFNDETKTTADNYAEKEISCTNAKNTDRFSVRFARSSRIARIYTAERPQIPRRSRIDPGFRVERVERRSSYANAESAKIRCTRDAARREDEIFAAWTRVAQQQSARAYARA